MRFRDKLALFFGSIVLVSTLLAIGMSYNNNVHHLIDQFGQSLIVLSNTAAADIDRNKFQSLLTPDQMPGKDYAAIRAQLVSLRRVAETSNVPLRYLYTMAPTDTPGTWRYIVDSQVEFLPDGTKNPDFSALGSIEKFAADDVILRCYLTGKPQADRDLKSYPMWGELMSVAVPIKDSSGKIIGIVGADAPPRAVKELKNELLQTAFVCVSAGLIVVIVGSALVAVQLTRPIDALVSATRNVADGDLTYEVPVLSSDEVGQLGVAFNQMTAGLRQRDLYKRQFERYVSRQIADTILANPNRDFWQGERRKASILFSDIRGFTAMSETLEPEEVVRRLNEYLKVMVEIVFQYDGTLDKFIGDAIMAVFGAPVNMGNDEERAIRAAIDMQVAAKRLETEWANSGQVGFKIGIGINTGDVIVGNIGSDIRVEYAAIGDTVNLASRLEGLNKDYGTGILVSEQTFRHIEHFVEARWVDKVAVRGRTEAVDIYEVLGLKDDAEPLTPNVA